MKKVLQIVLVEIIALSVSSVLWTFRVFPYLQLDELIFQINSSIAGTGSGIIGNFILTSLLPSVVFTFLVVILYKGMQEKYKALYRKSLLVFLVVSLVISVGSLAAKLNIVEYFTGNKEAVKNNEKEFIEENYVNPKDVNITFPTKKRNLIVLYLESMEMTYADKGDGGAEPDDYIPELVKIGEANEDFSGSEFALNGAHSLSGTTWTMGALFATQSGLPLKVSLSGEAMDAQDSFFPTVTTLGDILYAQGYQNVFMCGSDAAFGGRKTFFQTHGNYEVLDLNYMNAYDKLPAENYHDDWWGFEDEYLFEFAKEKLTELGNSGKPFNFNMLTVDTHFEDGHPCDKCQNRYSEQYANVIACSARQVESFLEWCKQQSWYDNTTILITGDHPTMDSDFLLDIDEDYDRRVFTAYINSARTYNGEKRQYSSFDTFPTLLASIGADIEGDKLGLGVNLYSSSSTLTEEMGVKGINDKLIAKSEFMENLSSQSSEDGSDE